MTLLTLYLFLLLYSMLYTTKSLMMIRSSEGFNIPFLLLISMTGREVSDIKLCPLSTTGSRSRDSMLSGNGSNFTENTQF